MPVTRSARQEWPQALSATSTHDTKHSEDVRARINVLSEIPDEWERAIWRWHHLTRIGAGRNRKWASSGSERGI